MLSEQQNHPKIQFKINPLNWGIPLFCELYEDGNLVCYAFIIINNNNLGRFDTVLYHIYVPTACRGRSYAVQTLNEIKKQSNKLSTGWLGSTEEGRVVCQKAGMVREFIDKEEYLVWRRFKLKGGEENGKVQKETSCD